jgi:hypothetical protein
VQILRLRRKIEADPSVPHIIQTTRGVGYVFALPVECFDMPQRDAAAGSETGLPP